MTATMTTTMTKTTDDDDDDDNDECKWTRRSALLGDTADCYMM